MLQVKGNFKNKYPDLTCRWCKKHAETQIHILSGCTHFQRITKEISYKTYYEDERPMIKEATTALELIIPQIDEMNNTP